MTIDEILNFARSQQAAGKLDQAAAAFERAAQVLPKDCTLLNDWGVCVAQLGNLDRAIALFKRTLRCDPRWTPAHKNLILALTRQNNLSEAESTARTWIQEEPNCAEAINQLGNVLVNAGRTAEAADCWKRCLKMEPANALFNEKLGRALGELKRNDEAIAPLQRAVAARPDSADMLVYLSAALVELHRYDETRPAIDRALALDPEHVAARAARAILALLTGDFAQGWQDYEWRWKDKSFPQNRRYSHVPQWTGFDIAGKTILLHAEQGLGDSIQFVRYATLVAQRGAKVILQCQFGLVPLLATVDGVSQCISDQQTPPRFDLHCPLMSLPLAFGTTLQTIPASVPYIMADEKIVQRWRPQLETNGKRKIGLVWGGRPEHKRDQIRSINLAEFAPLAKISDIVFFALQKGSAEAQARKPPEGMQLISLGPELKDFSDTAAVIAQLDLLISVDTAVVHLAGAMNKPVWTLLATVNDFRWLRDRTDSPWYPSMRLWRQTTANDWSDLMSHLAEELNTRR